MTAGSSQHCRVRSGYALSTGCWGLLRLDSLFSFYRLLRLVGLFWTFDSLRLLGNFGLRRGFACQSRLGHWLLHLRAWRFRLFRLYQLCIRFFGVLQMVWIWVICHERLFLSSSRDGACTG